jgi:cobyrinic acid a,c-diamide synthase
MKAPRILITAGASGSGKTTLVCGLLACLRERGIKTAAFKCGPDYIDPMFHQAVIQVPSKNLDTFFTDRETTRQLFLQSAKEVQFSVMEGVMGYYDGAGMNRLEASTYDVARTTQTPVVLLVNARGMSRSVLAVIKGFMEYQEDANIQGVILNQISQPLYETLKAEIEEELGIRAYGYLPMLSDVTFESRHLGLVTPDVISDLRTTIKKLAQKVEETVDVDGLLELGERAPLMEEPKEPEEWFRHNLSGPKVRIAVARDRAFSFYYEDNLRLLESLGAQLVPFSPIKDKTLPENVDGLILGGGYPELYLKELSRNTSMLQSIRNAIEDGMMYQAECGGFLYLHEQMEDPDGNVYPMAGVIAGTAHYTGRLCRRFGYVTLEMKKAGTDENIRIRAHEFHYYDSDHNGSDGIAKKPFSKRSWECMHVSEHGYAGFAHLYYYSNPDFVRHLIELCVSEEKNS